MGGLIKGQIQIELSVHLKQIRMTACIGYKISCSIR